MHLLSLLLSLSLSLSHVVWLMRNMMAHTQKPDFVFPWNGRVYLNLRGRQFSRMLAAEVCASAWVMLDTPRWEAAWEYWLPTPFTSFPFTSPPVRHRVPSGSERALTANMYHICMWLQHDPKRTLFHILQFWEKYLCFNGFNFVHNCKVTPPPFFMWWIWKVFCSYVWVNMVGKFKWPSLTNVLLDKKKLVIENNTHI